MKGQFFLLGGLLLIILFFIALPLALPSLKEPADDLPLLADNILREYPVAFNFAANASNQNELLRNFTFFVNETLADRNIRAHIFWVYSNTTSGAEHDTDNTVGASPSLINLTAGNFLGSSVTFSANISSVSASIAMNDNTTASISLSNTLAFYNLTLNFSTPTVVEWTRDKGNLYVFVELSRGTSLVRKDLSA